MADVHEVQEANDKAKFHRQIINCVDFFISFAKMSIQLLTLKISPIIFILNEYLLYILLALLASIHPSLLRMDPQFMCAVSCTQTR